MSMLKLVGRKVASVTGPGESVECPGRTGHIFKVEVRNGVPTAWVRWSDVLDGSLTEGYLPSALRDGGLGIGVYLVPRPLTLQATRWLLRLVREGDKLHHLASEANAAIDQALTRGGLGYAVRQLAVVFEDGGYAEAGREARKFAAEHERGELEVVS